MRTSVSTTTAAELRPGDRWTTDRHGICGWRDAVAVRVETDEDGTTWATVDDGARVQTLLGAHPVAVAS